MRQCFLRCILDSHPPIKLPHNVETIVGRSKSTKIKDQSCSRQQISLKADCDSCFVELKQLGINSSGLNGFALTKHGTYNVGHGSRVEILLNNYINIIEFDPPPDEQDEDTVSNKRKLEEEDNISKTKKMKCDVEVTDSWEDIDGQQLYIYTSIGVISRSKIAAFDMDGTLIKTKSGKVHPVDCNDWQIAFPQIPEKLKTLHQDGFKIVVLSNQAPLGNGRVKIADFKNKIVNLVKKLNVPIQAYFATGRGVYRKPMTGMWNYLAEEKNNSLEIDMTESFYCGDAAGRVANWAPGKKKDHSMADKHLAENLGLKFYTPEQYFLGHSVTNVLMSNPEFLAKEVISEPFNENLISQQQEILVFVGYPGSGKSFLSKQIEKKSNHKYVSVCRDVLGSWQKCAAQATDLIKKGKSVIVDSTNPDTESRGRWTKLAKDMNVQCRCANMLVSKAHAQHNNKFRELMKISHVPVNDIVFHTYKNKYVEPSPSEGFKEVIQVKFNATFEDEQAEKIYRMHLLEK